MKLSDSTRAERLVISDFLSFNESGFIKPCPVDAFEVGFDGGITPEYFSELVLNYKLFGPYCKLYFASVIKNHDIRFDTELKSAEDFKFNFEYIKYVNCLAHTGTQDYYYRVGYKKANPKFIGQSEIKSAHIMANEIVEFAKRLHLYDAVQEQIDIWVAKKHYLNRLPTCFAFNMKVSIKQRRKMYRLLCYDKVYRETFTRGKKYLNVSRAYNTALLFDSFWIWTALFFLAKQKQAVVKKKRIHENYNNNHKQNRL